jgi:glycosyltransferase involved in cell wall biosynthesis
MKSLHTRLFLCSLAVLSAILFWINLFPSHHSSIYFEDSYDKSYTVLPVADTVGSKRFPTDVSREIVNTGLAKMESTKIPRIVHFVFGMEKGAVFGLVQYLAVASASRTLHPEHIYLHYVHLPTGFYWDMLTGVVEVRRIEEIDSIFGQPVTHYAHKADVARLRALLEFGGIYLDLDMISLSSFDHLLNYDFVMGQEGEDGRIGLCNAVILASKESKFLKIWYESYSSFNSSLWNYHSVLLPNEIAAKYPSEIKILGHTSFFWPLWDKKALDIMYTKHNYDYKDNLAVHLWNSVARQTHTKDMSMSWLLQNRSSLLSKLDVYLPTPLFSVIIPCYNQRQYIDAAISSVVASSWPLWEIIVVDDGSPDRCGRYVMEEVAPILNRDSRRQLIKVIYTAGNVGISQARNSGIAAASGLWICALDADDRIGINYFALAEKAITANPDVNIIYSDQQYFGESSWVWNVPVFDPQSILTAVPIPVMSLYPRKLWDQVHGYSSALPYGNEDYDFWMTLMEGGLQGYKLKGINTFHRFKRKSTVPDSTIFTTVEFAMLHTRHLSLLALDTVLKAHLTISHMLPSTCEVIKKKLTASHVITRDAVFYNFWLGLYELQRGNKEEALSHFSSAMSKRSPIIKWQPAFYYASLLCQTDTTTGRQQLEKIMTKHPDLLIHRYVQQTFQSCGDFNVTHFV